MKKILIITTNFPPSTSIGTQRILKILKFINKNEFKPYVLTLKHQYFKNGLDSKPDSYVSDIIKTVEVIRTSKLDLNNKLLRLRDRIKLKLKGKGEKNQNLKNGCQKSEQRNKPSFIGNLSTFLEFPDIDSDWFPFALIHGYHLIKREEIDFIFSSSPRHSNHLISTSLKILTNKKLIIEFRDPWARVPWIEEKKRENMIARLRHFATKKLEQIVLKFADSVIFVTDEMKNEFSLSYPNLIKKFKVITNGYDKNLRKVSQFPKEKKIVFSHIGSLYQKRDPKPLFYAIQSMSSLTEEQSSFVFRFIGVIAEELNYIKELPSSLGIEKYIEFVSPVDYDDSLEIMAQSDILVLLQPKTTLQIPAKLYDYLNQGKPILAIGETNSAVENIVKNSLGLFADYNDTVAIKKSIIRIFDEHQQFRKLVVSNRDKFNFEFLINDFQLLLV